MKANISINDLLLISPMIALFLVSLIPITHPASRLIESSNVFEGGVVEPGPGLLRHPACGDT